MLSENLVVSFPLFFAITSYLRQCNYRIILGWKNNTIIVA